MNDKSEVRQRMESPKSDEEASTLSLSTSELDTADFRPMHLGNLIRGSEGRKERNLSVMPSIPHETREKERDPKR